jgi:uncharacterized protein YecT (DUF1311 family)
MTPTRFRFAVFALPLALVCFTLRPAIAAIAGQPNAADVKTIDECVADARKAKTDPDACIGGVTNKCLETASTTNAKEECVSRELRVWEAALPRDFAQLFASLADNNLQQALRDEERAFFLAKLKQCTFDRIAHKDAPDALITAERCNVRDTARQDLWLLDQIDSKSR